MSNHTATLKRGAILASIAVSSYAVFGHDAWAPQPAVTTGPPSGNNTTVGAYFVPTLEPTTVLFWPMSWTLGTHEGGRPCSPVAIPAGTPTNWVIERAGNYSRCTTWITQGARLDAALLGTGGTADATTLLTEEDTTVVLFPTTWTYDTTLAAETYCTPYAAPAGSAVGMIIVRAGNYAKCSS